MYPVYRLHTYNYSVNSHRVDRTETWVVKKDKLFSTYDDAKEYVIKKSLMLTDLVTYLAPGLKMVSMEEREKIIDAFCFTDNKYLTKRRFFIGLPPINMIKSELEKNKIKLINIT